MKKLLTVICAAMGIAAFGEKPTFDWDGPFSIGGRCFFRLTEADNDRPESGFAVQTKKPGSEEWRTVEMRKVNEDGVRTYLVPLFEDRYVNVNDWRVAYAETPDEWSVFQIDSRLPLKGAVSDYGHWNYARSIYAFDGCPATCFSTSGLGQSVGVDFGSPRVIAGFSLLPHCNLPERVPGITVYASNTGLFDWNNSWVAYGPLPAECATTQNLHFDFDEPVLARYVWLYNQGDMTIEEIEFCGLSTVSCDYRHDGYPVITVASSVTAEKPATIFRAFDAEGPWTELATLGIGETSYEDESAIIGLPNYYRVNELEVLTCTRLRRIGQNADASLWDGVSVICEGNPVSSDPNRNGASAFDGIVDFVNANGPDMNNVSNYGQNNNPKVGLDFGEGNEYYIAACRLIARVNNQWGTGRITSSILFGTTGSWTGIDEVEISPKIDYGYSSYENGESMYSGYDEGYWYELPVDSSKPYRCVFFCNKIHETFGNFGEIEFYGWTKEDLANLAVEPEDVALKTLVGGGFRVSWTCGGQPDKYLVERLGDDAQWETLGETTGTFFDDTGLEYEKEYTYRVSAVYSAFGQTKLSEPVSDICTEPLALTVTPNDNTVGDALIAWETGDGLPAASRVAIYRASSAQGPWTEPLATIAAGTTSYVDRSIHFGFDYYYRIQALDAGSGALSAVKAYRRFRTLSMKDGSGAFAHGIKILGDGIPYNNDPANGYESLFDGELGEGHWTDMQSMGYSRFGLDFGDNPAFLLKARVIPRVGGEYGTARVNGLKLYGCDGDWQTTGAEIATVYYPDLSVCDWLELPTKGDAAYHQLVFGGKTDSYANFGEVEFFGYGLYDDCAFGLKAVRTAEGIALEWDSLNTPSAFVIERSPVGADDFTVLAETNELAYLDTDVENGGYYDYRIRSRYDDLGLSTVSQIASASFYTVGSGTGLAVKYRTGYGIYDEYEGETTITGESAAPMFATDGAVVEGTETADYFRALYEGKLIVPVEGDWYFTLYADDLARLHIDGEWVTSSHFDRATGGPVHLTAGEHDISIAYYEGNGNAELHLFWKGPVEEEEIPLEQYIPGEVDDVPPQPWEGARSFGQDSYGSDAFFDDDGGVTIEDTGLELKGGNSGYGYVWRTLKGDFDFSCRFDRVSPANYQFAMLMVRSGVQIAKGFHAAAVGFHPDLQGGYPGWKWRDLTVADNENPINETMFATQEKYLTSGYFRAVREGDDFTLYVRAVDETDWTEITSFTAADGGYGDSVVIGPAVTTSWGGYKVPEVVRFSEFRLKNSGFVVIVR